MRPAVPALLAFSMAFSMAFLMAFLMALPAATVRGELFEFPEKPVDSRLAALKNAIDSIHSRAVKSKELWKEEDLRKRVPKKYLALEKRYSRIKDPAKRADALAQLALLYAELAWVEKIRPISAALEKLDGDQFARLGYFDASDHFVVRVVGADPKWGKAALELAEAARAGYLDLFGFEAISKVPGKKIRILIHVDSGISKRRLYFHPTPLYHGEFRYQVPAEKYLTRAGGQRIVYGFCHELGHMVAMWGKYRVVEDDKHAWAHYTGSLIVEEVYERLGNEPWPTWTAFQRRASGKARLLKQIEGKTSGTESYESILKLFYTIGDEFGTDVYGRAWKWLSKQKRFRTLNNVPYLWLKDLGEALSAVEPKKAKRVRELFGG